MEFSKVFWKNAAGKNKRFYVNQGGTSSTKTWTILQTMIIKAIKHDNLVISICSESYPHLRKGALRDFMQILEAEGLYNSKMHNKSDSTFKFGSSIIEFFSVEDSKKVRGLRRDILFINECNNVSYEVFEQLEIRTRREIYLDYNPVSRFWVHDEVLGRENVHYVQSTYQDAKDFLPQAIIDSIEARRHKKNWWRVFGLGEIGSLEGLVFPEFRIIDDIPKIDGTKMKLLGYGLDFGYTNSNTALIKVAMNYKKELFIDQKIYGRNIVPTELLTRIKHMNLGRSLIVADHQFPEMIDMLKYQAKVNIVKCIKGRDSVKNGIHFMQDFPINITKQSVETITEFRHYMWQEDNNGKYTDIPIALNDDAIDSIRYLVTRSLKKRGGAKKVV